MSCTASSTTNTTTRREGILCLVLSQCGWGCCELVSKIASSLGLFAAASCSSHPTKAQVVTKERMLGLGFLGNLTLKYVPLPLYS